jgi:hypothetical protein
MTFFSARRSGATRHPLGGSFGRQMSGPVDRQARSRCCNTAGEPSRPGYSTSSAHTRPTSRGWSRRFRLGGGRPTSLLRLPSGRPRSFLASLLGRVHHLCGAAPSARRRLIPDASKAFCGVGRSVRYRWWRTTSLQFVGGRSSNRVARCGFSSLRTPPSIEAPSSAHSRRRPAVRSSEALPTNERPSRTSPRSSRSLPSDVRRISRATPVPRTPVLRR